jgi:hypothetical protein
MMLRILPRMVLSVAGLCSFDRLDGDRGSWWSGLFGGAYEQFGDGHVAGAGDDVADGVRDVVALEPFDVAQGGGDAAG